MSYIELKIRSKILGRTLVFFCEEDYENGHPKNIFVDDSKDQSRPGSTGRQLFARGSSIMATSENFERKCRRWYQSYIQDLKLSKEQ